MSFKLIPDNVSFNFVKQSYFCFIISVAIIIGSFVSLYSKGLNYGIDFAGGILVELRTDEEVPISKFREILNDRDFKGAIIQNFGSKKDVIIRIRGQENNNQAEVVNKLKTSLNDNIKAKIDYRKTDYVGPQVGSELKQSAIYAFFIALAAMLIYIWLRFEWQYGLGAIVALLHDGVAVIGFFSITGLEFNLTSVAAVLTVIGYSINDTVVIYDRVRENLARYKDFVLKNIINKSVNETLSRTIITAGTTILALAALIILGGSVLESFSWGMMFGVIIGTYSSIYVASSVLLFMGLARQEDETEEDELSRFNKKYDQQNSKGKK